MLKLFSLFTYCSNVAVNAAADMVHALIDAAYDKEPRVQEVICNTLCEVGKKRPNLVLASCHDYLLKHSKVRTDRG